MANITITGLENASANAPGGFSIPFIPGGDILSGLTGGISSLLGVFLPALNYIVLFTLSLFNMTVYAITHLYIIFIFLEIFIIAMTLRAGGGDPVLLIQNYVLLHFQLIRVMFSLVVYIIFLIYQGIVALTTWIP